MRCCRHCLFASGRFGVDGSMRAALLSIAFILVTLGVQLASGQGSARWPQFRGPNAGGVATGKAPPTEFSPSKAVRWKRALPAGHSSPAVWGQHIFVTAFDQPAGKLEVLCLSTKHGRSSLAPRRSCGADRKRSRREQPGDRHAGRRRRECLCVLRVSRRPGARSRWQGAVVRAPVAAQDLVRQRHLSSRVGRRALVES